MCRHDTVVLESGVQDFMLPLEDFIASELCIVSSEAECRSFLLHSINNETWRLRPFASYKARVQALVAGWRRCRAAKPHFRAIFKLAPAPRSQMSCGDDVMWSLATASAQHLAEANRIAREVVEGAGFEVFDAFGVSLHGPSIWLADGSEATSDLVTQLFLSQLCGRAAAGASRRGDDTHALSLRNTG